MNLFEFTDHLMHKYLEYFDNGMVPKRQYVFYLLDPTKTSIVRLLNLKDTVRDIEIEIKNKGWVLALTTITVEELSMLRTDEVGILFCLPVNQYTICFSTPFFVIVEKNYTIDQVRLAIIEKLFFLNITYEYGKDPLTKESILRDITIEQKDNFIPYYCEYKTSRR